MQTVAPVVLGLALIMCGNVVSLTATREVCISSTIWRPACFSVLQSNLMADSTWQSVINENKFKKPVSQCV